MMERQLGYRITGHGAPSFGTIDPISVNSMKSYRSLYGDEYNRVGEHRLDPRDPRYNMPAGQHMPINKSIPRNDVSGYMPADYKVAIAQDEQERQRIARDIEKGGYEGTETRRRIISSEDVGSINNARRNPEGVIYDSNNNEIVNQLARQNELLSKEVEMLKSMIQDKGVKKAPGKIIRRG